MPFDQHNTLNYKLVHQLKNRVRIVSPLLVKDQERCYILEILLKKRKEIKRIRTTPSIGSIAIEFNASRLPKSNLLKLLDVVLSNLAQQKSNPKPSSKVNLTGTIHEVDLAVQGMTCASCALLIEMVLNREPKIKSASVNFATETATIHGLLDRQQVTEKIASLGYEALPMDTLSQRKNIIHKEEQRIVLAKKRFFWSALLSAPVIAVAMTMTTSSWIKWLQFFLTTPVVLGSGKPFFDKAWRLAQQKTANMDTLIALGVGSAYGYSLPGLFKRNSHLYFEAAAAIITFVLLGRYLEESARGKAGESIRKLIDLQPQTATLIRGNEEILVNVDDVQLDDILLIRPGEKIPTDGEVIFGLSTVDESMVTGESMPVVKEIGHKVIGGCINGNGVLHIKTTAVGMDTVLAGIVHMVDQAQASKLPIQKMVDQISAVFVPAVIGISAVTFSAWLISGASLATAFGSAVAVLLIACPCALGLATPAAIMVGTGQAAKHGIYIKNGESLEIATRLNAIVFDKTGTITEGHPKVTDFFVVSDNEPETVLSIAASAEKNSEHFLAKAIVDYAKEKSLSIKECQSFHSETGSGIEANVQGCIVLLGNLSWLQKNQLDCQALTQQAELFSEQGKTAIYMAIDQHPVAVFGIADKARPSASSAIQRLHELGISTLMVTGDTLQTAQHIAAQVGIKQVIANAKPDEKLDVIRQLQAEGKQVGMIGDGINDAPALTAANVGFAIGTGTDIAIESADLTLVQGDINKVKQTIELSTGTINVIKQNLFWAFGYNVISIPIAAFGKLSPMVASAAMAMSSVSVILNSLRLSKK